MCKLKESSDIYTAIYPVHLICTFFGHAPFKIEINYDSSYIRFPKIFTAYTFGCMILFSFIFIEIHNYLITIHYYAETTITLLNDSLSLYSIGFITLVATALSRTHRNAYTNIFNIIYNININMLKLNIPMSYRNAGLISTSLTLIHVFVDFIILCLSHIIFQNTQNYFKYFYVLLLPRLAITTVECKFKLVVYILNSNLKVLNNYLEHFSPAISNTNNALKNCNSIFEKSVRNGVTKNLNEIYNMLLKNAEILNEMFSPIMLLFIVHYFSNLLNNIYYIIYIRFISPEDYFETLMYFSAFWSIWDIQKVYIITLLCSNFTNQVRNFP